MLRSTTDCRDIGTSDKDELDSLAEAFAHLLSSLNHHIAIKPVTPETVADNCFASGKEEKETPGRPRFNIPTEMLEELRELEFSWIKIGEMLGVSRWTIHRRVEEYGLQNMTGFHHLPDEELDEIVRSFISDHGRTTGQGYVGGYIKAVGFRIQRKRIRESMARVDPQNTALRWGVVVSRRIYQVPWPNSLWHLDGHYALILWKIIIHGCIDGFSRRIMYLRCNSNNLTETVLVPFLQCRPEICVLRRRKTHARFLRTRVFKCAFPNAHLMRVFSFVMQTRMVDVMFIVPRNNRQTIK